MVTFFPCVCGNVTLARLFLSDGAALKSVEHV